MEVLFAKETRETGPSGWEGGGIGQPLPTEALSACGAHLHVVRCRAPPGRGIQKRLQAAVARAEDPCVAGRWSKVRLCSLSGPWPWGRLFDRQDWVAEEKVAVSPAKAGGPWLPSGRGQHPPDLVERPLPGKGEEGTKHRLPSGPWSFPLVPWESGTTCTHLTETRGRAVRCCKGRAAPRHVHPSVLSAGGCTSSRECPQPRPLLKPGSLLEGGAPASPGMLGPRRFWAG